MEETDLDRQAFLSSRNQGPRAIPPGAVILLLLVVLAALGFGAYKLMRSMGSSEPAGANADLTQIEQELALVEKRLDQLEKRHKAPPAESSTATPKPPDTAASSSGGSSPAPRPRFRVIGGRQPSPPPASVPHDPRVGKLESGLESLRTDLAANQEALGATTNRLADVVGEVGSERNEIAQHRKTLEELLARSEHNFLRFDLHRGEDRQQVGPVSIGLKGTDLRRQRYTVRVFVDDKWIEMKDRALYEAVKFYASGAELPLELVATQIGRDEVVGYLAVPLVKTGR